MCVAAGIAQRVLRSSVQDAESANLTLVPGEWTAIYGANLAGSVRTWTTSDFGAGNALPTSIDGVSVQFGGIPAAVFYVSPTQLNVQVPDGVSGSVPVTVTFDGIVSAAFTATIGQNAPSFFVYQNGNTLYPAATHADNTLIGDPAVQPGSTKAKAGEEIVFYINGLAPSPAGVLISSATQYTDPVTVNVGTESASVVWAGLVSAGLFQANVVVPSDLAAGNYPITLSAGGKVSPGTVVLTVQ